ncbi:amidohydrolase family protein [Acidobacteriota bacterium]
MKTRAILLLVCFLFCFSVFNAYAGQVILIKNGTIVPVVGQIIPNGSLLIKDGKIAAVGTQISTPDGATVIDAKGMFVYPGLIAPMTAIGVTGYPGAGNDTDEVGVSTPQMDPYDAINPEDESIDVTRSGGITTVMTVSGSGSVINGKAVILNLEGDLAEDMVTHRYVAQIINVGAKESSKYPSTLPGVMAFLRDKFDQAKQYAEKQKKGDKQEKSKDSEKNPDPSKRNLEMEALVPVVQGKVPVVILTYDEVTLRNALNLIKEYGLKGIIQARTGIMKYLDRLASEKIPVIWAGTANIPTRWEPFDQYYNTAAALEAHGVLFTFDPGGWGLGSRMVRNITVPASLSVAHGLSEEAAIKALTIDAARILGIDDVVGSLEKGKTANVVVWTGSPIQMRSRVNTVIINGKIVPLTNVQTRLRDKFDKLVRERMKKK